MGRFRAILPAMKSFFQGRPMIYFFETVFGYTDKSSTTLPYIVLFILFAVTTLLFYRVLRMRFPHLFCVIVALFFILSPLTTVRQNLMIEFAMGPAFICVLSAILVRRRHPIISYFLAIVALLTYESIFLLFLAAPLFERGRLRRKKLTAVAVHLSACVLIVIGSVMLRRVIGEERVVTATAVGPTVLLGRTLALDLYSSVRCFVTYWYAAWVSWRASSLEPLIYLGGFYIWGLMVLLIPRSVPWRQTSGSRRLQVARRTWWLRNGGILSLVLISIGYLTIYFQAFGGPISFAGRETRFSMSAVPGSCMFIGSVFMLLMLTVRPWLRWITLVLVMSVLSISFIYSFVIQDDYVRAWDYQRDFLSQVILLTPDLELDGVIVVRTSGYPQPGFGPEDRIASIGWMRFGLQVSLKCLGNWSTSPEIIFVSTDSWKDHIRFGSDGRLHWAPRESGSVSQFIIPGRVIVLDEHTDGLLSRSDDPVIVEGRLIIEPRLRANIAFGKPALQSSTFSQLYAGNGVDGHLTWENGSERSAWPVINGSHLLQRLVSPHARAFLTRMSARPRTFCGFHTAYEVHPWWEVDLGRSSILQQVRVFNRMDFASRAANLRLLLSDDDMHWNVVYENNGKLFGPEPLSIDLADVSARYVRIDLAKPNWLHLEQVEVFGR
jgi:hypothetical protein